MVEIEEQEWYRMDSWSFNEALGDTIMEKYESLYVKLFQMFGETVKAYTPPQWIICGPDLASIFETATSGFEPEPWPENVELFKLDFYKLGRINKRFDIYVDKNMTDQVYVGCEKGIKRLTIKDMLI